MPEPLPETRALTDWKPRNRIQNEKQKKQKNRKKEFSTCRASEKYVSAGQKQIIVLQTIIFNNFKQVKHVAWLPLCMKNGPIKRINKDISYLVPTNTENKWRTNTAM